MIGGWPRVLSSLKTLLETGETAARARAAGPGPARADDGRRPREELMAVQGRMTAMDHPHGATAGRRGWRSWPRSAS